MATTGFSAGIETNQTQLTYVVETAYAAATPPTTGWKALRYVSENLAGSKARQRPSEINITREMTQGVTVSENAAGTLSAAFSYSTYDDLIASAMGAVWGTPVAITGAAANIALTVPSGIPTLTITSATWVGLSAGMWIRLLGFVTSSGVNNNIYRIASMTTTILTLAAPFHTPVAETPTLATAQVRALQITNGTTFTSLYIQQMLTAGSYYLVYPGTYVTGFQIQGSVGNFVTINFPTIAQQEKSGTTALTGSTGLTAPTGTVFNTVGNFVGISWNDVAIAATVDQFGITVDNQGATAEYGLGSSIAAGILSGTFGANGTMRMYFKDFTLYSQFKSETAGKLSIAMKDSAGSGYVFTFPNALLLNPQVQSGGPGQSVLATFQIEGNPQSTGGTLLVDRLVGV